MFSYPRIKYKVGSEKYKVELKTIIAEEILFRGVLRHCFYSENIDAITGSLRLNTLDIADSLCCMYLIARFSQLLLVGKSRCTL